MMVVRFAVPPSAVSVTSGLSLKSGLPSPKPYTRYRYWDNVYFSFLFNIEPDL